MTHEEIGLLKKMADLLESLLKMGDRRSKAMEEATALIDRVLTIPGLHGGIIYDVQFNQQCQFFRSVICFREGISK